MGGLGDNFGPPPRRLLPLLVHLSELLMNAISAQIVELEHFALGYHFFFGGLCNEATTIIANDGKIMRPFSYRENGVIGYFATLSKLYVGKIWAFGNNAYNSHIGYILTVGHVKVRKFGAVICDGFQ
jgi:hypothetical protein